MLVAKVERMSVAPALFHRGLVALLLSTTLLRSQSVATDEAPPTIHVSTQIVSIDVAVVDRKGHPIAATLGRDDFSITEDGRPQQLRYFEPPSIHPKPTSTVFVLDDLNTGTADSSYYLAKLTQYLAALPETLSSPVELLVLDKTSFQIVQSFTQSRAELLSALAHLPARDTTTLNLEADDFLSKTLSALESIALQNLGDAARLNVVWLGPGAGVDTNNQTVTMRARTERFVRYMTNTLLEGRMTLYVMFPPGTALGPTVRFGYQSDRASEQGTEDPYNGSINFRLLAAETGGFVYSGMNDPLVAIGKALELGKSYYVLAYRPEDTIIDGRFRTIRVALRNANLHVVTKSGYYAPEVEKQDGPQMNQIFQMSEAGKSTLPFHHPEIHVAQIIRSPDEKAAEFTIFAEGNELPWRSEGRDQSLSELRVGGLSLSREGKMLSSQFRNVTMRAHSQDPLALRGMKASFKLVLSIPATTDHVRLVVQSVKNGQLGCVDASRAAISAAPQSPITLIPGS